MRKFCLLLGIFLFGTLRLYAQGTSEKKSVKLDGRASLTGRIVEAVSTDPLPQVTVQLLLKADSSFVYGTVTDNDGWYTIKKVPVGEYMLRHSFMGYNTFDYDVKVIKEDRDRELGVFRLFDSSTMLDEAVIEEALPPTQVVDDTLMYNVSAYRVPEGSVLEDLIKRLPGADLDENGGITINGKQVSRILVDGEEYFGRDLSMATKNLPVSIVHRIKTYQRKSDLARVTGIDDGEEETVLDLQIKPDKKRGWIHNLDAGLGTPVGNNDFGEWLKYLYSGRYTLNRFQTGTQFSVTANTNNSGRGNGVSESQQLGVNFSRNIGDKFPRRRNEYPLQVGGNVRWNGSSSRSMNESESETFTTEYTQSSFRNNRSSNQNGNGGASGEFRLEWRPDTTIDIIFRPSFSLSRNNSSSNSASVTFNTDPYEATQMKDILNEYRNLPQSVLDQIGVNSQSSTNRSDGKSNQFDTELQFNKKFSEDGRNLTFRFTYASNGGESRSYSSSNQIYYQRHERDTIMNRYNFNPTDNNNWSGRVMWSEPMDSGRKHLQVSYQVQVSNRKTNRETYVFPSKGEFADWDENWQLPYEIEQYRNAALSRQATNVSRNHNFTLQYRHNTDHMNLNLGFSVMPQYTGMDNFQYMGHVIGDTSRVVVNWTPTLNYRYRWTSQRSAQVTFRSNTSQPSMEQMLDITDDSNPLNISKGNPGLLPSLSNNLELNFQDFVQETQRTFNARISLQNSLRNISNRTDYDPTTGVSVTQPKNMEGFWTNWNVSGNLTWNRSFKENKLRASTSMNGSFRHQESYMRTGSIGNYNSATGNGGQAVLSTTRTITAGDNAQFSYRNKWLELSLNGRFSYNHSENNVRQNSNMDTYNFSYGGRTNVRLPWHNVNFDTDINMQSRRGYSGSYNRDDLIWNASASISFLPGNAATFRVQYFDILNDESNINRTVSTTGRTDTKNNSVHSYIMAHLIVRASLFGSRKDQMAMLKAVLFPKKFSMPETNQRRGGQQGQQGQRAQGGQQGQRAQGSQQGQRPQGGQRVSGGGQQGGAPRQGGGTRP